MWPDDPMTVSRLKVRDGTQLAYELRGRVGDAPPVVLIHSLGMDRTFWNAVTPPLAQTTAVLLYDCRGHGQSDKPKGPYRIEQFANDLADLMDGVGWRSAVIAGASMGGCAMKKFSFTICADPENTIQTNDAANTAWPTSLPRRAAFEIVRGASATPER